jgi:hypothetical protein
VQPLAASQRASTLFSKKIRQRGIVEHRISQQPLQVGFLIPKPLQTLRLADIDSAILGLPPVNGRIADAVLAAQIGDGNPGLKLFQNTDYLIFGEPATLHLWSFRSGQSLPQTGLGGGGNVIWWLATPRPDWSIIPTAGRNTARWTVRPFTEKRGIHISISGRGNCYDNSMVLRQKTVQWTVF